LIVVGLANPLTYLAAHLLGVLGKILEENLAEQSSPRIHSAEKNGRSVPRNRSRP
jgi:hypothetical protein